MAMTSDKWSPYMTLQKEHLAKQAGVKKWEDIFLQPYEQAAQQVQTQAAYDISGAFAQYKQAELSAMRNTQLGSGFKEQIASSLAGQYSTAFAQTKQQEASDIYTLQQQASKTLASEEAKLQETAKMYAGLEEAILEQHGIDIKQAQTSEKAVFGKDEKGADIYGLGYFELQPDGSYAITERGRDFFDKALNKGLALTDEQGKETGEYEQFADYLKTTGREDLYDFYVQNLGTTREFLGGIESTDLSYDSEDAKKSVVLQYEEYVPKSIRDTISDEELNKIVNDVETVRSIGASRAPGSSNDSKLLVAKDILNNVFEGSTNVYSNSAENKYTIQISKPSEKQIVELEKLGFVRTLTHPSSSYDSITNGPSYVYRLTKSPQEMEDLLLTLLKQKGA